jgi:hypothetical protein
MKKLRAIFAVLAAFALLGAATVQADEITDQLERGLKLYKEGKYGESLNEIDFASAQIRQKKADTFAGAFPDAPAGWTAEKAETQAIAKALFGGGITATRNYKQDKNRVKMELVTDSPLLQSMAMVINNPMMMQGGQGMKPVRVGDERGMLQTHNNRAELQLIVDGKVLVKVEVNAGDKSEDTAKEFANRLDIKKLKELAK